MTTPNDTTKTRRWLLLPTGVGPELSDGRLALGSVQCRAYALLKGWLRQRVEPRFPALANLGSAETPEPVEDDALEAALADATGAYDGLLCVDVHDAADGLQLVCRCLPVGGELSRTEKASGWESLFADTAALLAEVVESDAGEPEEDPHPTGLWVLFYLTSLLSPDVQDVVVGPDGVALPDADSLLGTLPEALREGLADKLLDGLSVEPLAAHPEWAQLFAEVAAGLAPDSPEPARVLGELAAFGQGDEEAAAGHFETALAKAEGEKADEIRLGWAKCLEFLDNLDKAEEEFSKLLDGSQRKEALYGLGRVAERRGDGDKYLEHCATAAAEAGDDAAAVFELATAQRAVGELDKARASFRRALELDKTLASSLVDMGAQLLDAGRTDLAAGVYQDLLEIVGESPAAYFGLGQVGLFEGDLPVAEECFRRVLDLSSQARYRGPAATQLARILQEVGAVDEAAAMFAEAQRAALALQAEAEAEEAGEDDGDEASSAETSEAGA